MIFNFKTVIEDYCGTGKLSEDEICKVLSFVGGARDPLAPTLFQVANVDTGEIKFVHAEEIKAIVCSWDQEKQHQQ